MSNLCGRHTLTVSFHSGGSTRLERFGKREGCLVEECVSHSQSRVHQALLLCFHFTSLIWSELTTIRTSIPTHDRSVE